MAALMISNLVHCRSDQPWQTERLAVVEFLPGDGEHFGGDFLCLVAVVNRALYVPQHTRVVLGEHSSECLCGQRVLLRE